MSQVRRLDNEPAAPIKALVESETDPRPHTISCSFTEDNKVFIDYLCRLHNQPQAYVVDRLVEAAKLGVPYRIPTRMSVEMTKALEWINKRRTIEARAKMMMAKVRDSDGNAKAKNPLGNGKPRE